MNYFGIIMPLALIFVWYNRIWDVIDIGNGAVLVSAFLLSVGLSVLFKKNYHGTFFYSDGNYQGKSYSHADEDVIDGEVFEKSTQEDGESIVINRSFGEEIRHLKSQSLRDVDIRCSFGSVKVYFEEARLANNSAQVSLDCTFGGIEIYVPRNWNVDNQIHGAFGAADFNNTSKASPEDPVLHLSGSVNFGGVEITFV